MPKPFKTQQCSAMRHSLSSSE